MINSSQSTTSPKIALWTGAVEVFGHIETVAYFDGLS